MTTTEAFTYNTTAVPDGNNEDIECVLFDGDTTKCEVVQNLKRVSASLSIIGSLFMLGLIVLFKKYREPSQRMIAHLSTASIFLGVSYLIEDDIVSEATLQCKFQGASLTLFIWACFLWIMCMLFNLYFQLLFEFDFRKYEVAVTLVCWVLPVMISAVPFIGDVYAPAGAWCWIENNFEWRFGIWYIWRILFVIVFVLVMVHISWKLHKSKGIRHSSTYSMTSFEKDVHSLRIYPIVYFILNLFPIINRVHNAIVSDDENGKYNFVLLILHSFIGPLFGVTISVVYAFDSRTRQNLNRRSIYKAFHGWFQKKSVVKEYSGTVSSDLVASAPSESATDAAENLKAETKEENRTNVVTASVKSVEVFVDVNLADE